MIGRVTRRGLPHLVESPTSIDVNRALKLPNKMPRAERYPFISISLLNRQ